MLFLEMNSPKGVQRGLEVCKIITANEVAGVPTSSSDYVSGFIDHVPCANSPQRKSARGVTSTGVGYVRHLADVDRP